MRLLSSAYLDPYAAALGFDLATAYRDFRARQATVSAEDFGYYLVAASVFSSRIEGVSLDLNSFMRNRQARQAGVRKEVREVEGLVRAYEFATENPLTLENLLKAHQLLAAGLPGVFPRQRGRFRQTNVAVWDTSTGRMVYAATEPQEVPGEMQKLFADAAESLTRDLTDAETVYFASMLHLWIAMIHPFVDGNGRAARLVEKWFLARKLGREAWGLRSEKFYWDHRPDYYRNIALGLNYYALKWERCLPFLHMLPQALAES